MVSQVSSRMEHVYYTSSVYLSRFYKEKLRLKRLLLYGFGFVSCFLLQKAGAAVPQSYAVTNM